MKKSIALLLLICLIFGLCACKKAPDYGYKPTEPSTVPTEPSTLPTEPEPDPEPVILYRHPLDGTPLDAPWEGRPTAVVVNNIEAALPHYGTSDAKFLYEVETESGITRMLAIFDDISSISQIGPIRSVRTFFNNIAVSYDAPVVHCGGSVRGRNAYYDAYNGPLSTWNHLDAYYYENSYFFRDTDRYNYQGYNWEHCLFSNGELLAQGLVARGINEPTDRSTDFGLTFAEEVTLSGENATTVTSRFDGGKTTTFTYDAQKKLYNTAQYGSDYIDTNNGEIVTFRNLIMLYTEQTYGYDGEYTRSYYELIGEGQGLLAIDGTCVPILWSRESLESNFVYTLEDGTPITLGTGHTYVAISSAEADYS